VLDHHSVLGTLHSPGRVEKKRFDAPKGNKQPTPLGQMIVGGRWLEALPASGADILVRLNAHLDSQPPGQPTPKSDVLVNKTCKTLNPVQDGLNF
jgi:hypothetical protein